MPSYELPDEPTVERRTPPARSENVRRDLMALSRLLRVRGEEQALDAMAADLRKRTAANRADAERLQRRSALARQQAAEVVRGVRRAFSDHRPRTD